MKWSTNQSYQTIVPWNRSPRISEGNSSNYLLRVWRYQGLIRRRKYKKGRRHNDQNEKEQKDKQWSIKHYTEN
jgi:hypothetical protein